MVKVKVASRYVKAFLFGLLGSLAGFGLMLPLAWRVGDAWGLAYKLDSLLLVSALSMMLGGYLGGLLAGGNRVRFGLVFGLLFGAYALAYLLGPRWEVLAGTAVAGVFGAAGGQLASGTMTERLQR